MDRYGYIGIETLLNYCENSKDHVVTPNDFMRMNRVRNINCSEFPNNWIPCSERLPEKEGRYLVWAVVSFTPDHVDEPCEYQQTTIASYFYRRSCWYGEKVEKVIAWQPLPSPYQPKEETWE